MKRIAVFKIILILLLTIFGWFVNDLFRFYYESRSINQLNDDYLFLELHQRLNTYIFNTGKKITNSNELVHCINNGVLESNYMKLLSNNLKNISIEVYSDSIKLYVKKARLFQYRIDANDENYSYLIGYKNFCDFYSDSISFLAGFGLENNKKLVIDLDSMINKDRLKFMSENPNYYFYNKYFNIILKYDSINKKYCHSTDQELNYIEEKYIVQFKICMDSILRNSNVDIYRKKIILPVYYVFPPLIYIKSEKDIITP